MWPVLVLVGCIPTPDAINLTGADPSAYFDTGGEVPGGWESSSSDPWEPGESSGESSGSSGSTGQPPAGSDSGGESSSTGELPLPSFPEPAPFGDDAVETGLVGTWTSPWVPDGLASVSLAVEADGRFAWTEASGDCVETYAASGMLWVEGTQLVLHVEAWDKRDPWPLTEPLELPFRLRLPFGVVNGVMGLAGDEALAGVRAWEGRSYARVGSGTGPGGSWMAQAELWGLIRGEPEPRLIVSDTHQAELAAGGAATLTIHRAWSYPDAVDDPPNVGNGTWVDHHPGYAAGAVTISGTVHAYSPETLVTWDNARGLKLGVLPPCG